MKIEKLGGESFLRFVGVIMLVTAILVLVIDVKIKNDVIRAANQAHKDLENFKTLGGIFREESHSNGSGLVAREPRGDDPSDLDRGNAGMETNDIAPAPKKRAKRPPSNGSIAITPDLDGNPANGHSSIPDSSE